MLAAVKHPEEELENKYLIVMTTQSAAPSPSLVTSRIQHIAYYAHIPFKSQPRIKSLRIFLLGSHQATNKLVNKTEGLMVKLYFHPFLFLHCLQARYNLFRCKARLSHRLATFDIWTADCSKIAMKVMVGVIESVEAPLM